MNIVAKFIGGATNTLGIVSVSYDVYTCICIITSLIIIVFILAMYITSCIYVQIELVYKCIHVINFVHYHFFDGLENNLNIKAFFRQ